MEALKAHHAHLTVSLARAVHSYDRLARAFANEQAKLQACTLCLIAALCDTGSMAADVLARAQAAAYTIRTLRTQLQAGQVRLELPCWLPVQASLVRHSWS